MLFVTHLAAAALLGRFTRLPAVWVVVGAALPDVVDKPLAWLGLVEPFHSIAHTALLLPVACLIALSSRRGAAVALGWGSHLALDALHIVLNGRPDDALFLGWPVVSPTDPLGIPPGEFFIYYLWTPSFFLEAAFWTALIVWVIYSHRTGVRTNS
ncbi:metal-dependent hydrolase [Halococcus sp. IIIV-5B]|uniref:metal-dependent hydrolase n=1 Tax=Halococcus sp. IIIV-5B TaxID=2321230 RepID=UPI000E718284|nr:metal-dependent hydrolase [Halococcus sp. IIIV-5B]RJT07136.1 metal-dependent hydrolase [Halococcus sp. IIIV-5B]